MFIHSRKAIIVGLLIIAAGSLGFFAGLKYQQNQTAKGFNQRFRDGANRLNGQTAGQRNNFRPVSGEIISQDKQSLTVKLIDNSSKIILISDKTSINKTTTGAVNDLKTGEKISIFGQENSDGSINAVNIQLNPINRPRNLLPNN